MLKLLRSWFQKENGSMAVEFSFVSLPFIFMIIGTIETALMFTSQSLLSASTATAARLIRTGQIQQGAGDPEETFRNAVCDFAAILIPCDDIQFQVLDLEDFGAADDLPDATFDENGNLQNQGFSPGGVNDVVLIRVAYNYNIVTPLMQPVLTNTGGSTRTMLSTIVLQTEPYQFEN